MQNFKKKLEQKYVLVSDAKVNVFVYETLMDSRLWKVITKSLSDKKGTPDQVYGYREVSVDTNDGPDYHTLLEDPENNVWGRVYRVQESVLKRLDAWENQYERKVFLLHSGRRAYVYLLKTEAMKDFGKNKSYDVSTEELNEAESF